MELDPLAVQVERRILLIRQQKVMLDYDLASLYGVETRALKQAVRRNRDRFPEDFMFTLIDLETGALVSQCVIPGRGRLGGAAPYAFTDQSVAMLSSVLRSPRAVQVDIAIMRTGFGHKSAHIETQQGLGRFGVSLPRFYGLIQL